MVSDHKKRVTAKKILFGLLASKKKYRNHMMKILL